MIRNILFLAAGFFAVMWFMNWRTRARHNDIQERLGVDVSDPQISDENIIRILNLGRKIEAIKAYRNKYGVQLIEAKEAIEYAERHGSFEKS